MLNKKINLLNKKKVIKIFKTKCTKNNNIQSKERIYCK